MEYQLCEMPTLRILDGLFVAPPPTEVQSNHGIRSHHDHTPSRLSFNWEGDICTTMLHVETLVLGGGRFDAPGGDNYISQKPALIIHVLRLSPNPD